MNLAATNQVSNNAKGIEKARIPEALKDFSLSDLRNFCLLSWHMLEGMDLTDALQKENLARPDRDRFESIHKALKDKIGLQIMAQLQGRKTSYKSDANVVARLRQILGCIDDAIERLKPIGEMRKETLRPIVRIASVLSVVNYLGPALLDKSKQCKKT